MTEHITWSMMMAVSGGPSMSESGYIDVDAYDKIEAEIPIGSEATTVEVQPGDATALKAIIIRSDNYTALTYTVDEDATIRTLSKPLALIGADNLALLGVTCKNIIFTNADTEVANVTIMAFRDAIGGT